MGKPKPSPIVIGGVTYEDYSQLPVSPIEFREIGSIVENIVSEASFIVVPSLLQMLNTDSRLDVVEALVDVAMAAGQTKKLLDWVITLALDQCTDPTMVLRECSLASVVIGYYLRRVALTEIFSVTRQCLSDLHECKVNLDITEIRAVDTKSSEAWTSGQYKARIKENKKEMIRHAQAICDSLTSNQSLKLCKTRVGYLMTTLRKKLEERFNNPEITWTALANVFYLRFVFGNMTDVRSWKRELKITKNNTVVYLNVGKIMKIPNQSVQDDFGESHEYRIFNKFLQTIRPKFKKFLDEISAKWNGETIASVTLTPQQKTRRVSTILDYFTKSRSSAFPEFSRQLTDITIKLQNENKPFDQNSLGAAYMQLNSIFLQKQEIKTYLLNLHESEGIRRNRWVKRLQGKNLSSKELRALATTIVTFKKEDFDGEELYSYDIKKTLINISQEYKFVVLVFYRGIWCDYCQQYMKEWNEYVDCIVNMGGLIVGICSQGMQLCEEAQKTWDIDFKLLGDPENILANEFGVSITTDAVKGTGYNAMNAAFYPFGLAQPAVIAYTPSTGAISFSWTSKPQKNNQHGGKDRINVQYCVRKISAIHAPFSKSGSESSLEFSLDTSDEEDFALENDSLDFDRTVHSISREVKAFPGKEAEIVLKSLSKAGGPELFADLVRLMQSHKTYRKLCNLTLVEQCDLGCDESTTPIRKKRSKKHKHRSSHRHSSSKKDKKKSE